MTKSELIKSLISEKHSFIKLAGEQALKALITRNCSTGLEDEIDALEKEAIRFRYDSILLRRIIERLERLDSLD